MVDVDLPPAGLAPDDPAWFNAAAHHAAAEVVDAAITSAMSGPMNVTVVDAAGTHRQHVTLVDAPAGAGKTYLVTEVVQRAHAAGMRLLVVTPGNDQLGELALRTTRVLGGAAGTVGVLHRQGELGDVGDELRSVGATVTSDADGLVAADVVICTLHKLMVTRHHAHAPKDLGTSSRPFGLAVVDEAYQASGPVFAAVAAACPRLLLVGDPGQLKPFSTDPYALELQGLAEDPTQSASAMVVANFGDTIARFRMPITRRLPASAVPVARLFYPDHPFDAWTLTQTRIVDRSVVPANPSARLVRSALADGWRHVCLPPDPSRDDADPEVSATVADLAAAAVVAPHRLASEATGGRWLPLETDRVAVLVARNNQRQLVEAALVDRLGDTPRPVVGTANSLQGLEFDLTVVWYPLAGQSSFDDFRGDPARLAVMLTRHRHGCVLVGRGSDGDIFEKDVPPLGELNMAFVDPITRGWLTHLAVLRQLRPYRIDVCGHAADGQ